MVDFVPITPRWARMMNRDEYPSNVSVFEITGVHVLFLSSRKDKLIRPYHMDNLLTLCSSEKKGIVYFPKSGHSNSKILPEYWNNIENWVIGVVKDKEGGSSKVSLFSSFD